MTTGDPERANELVELVRTAEIDGIAVAESLTGGMLSNRLARMQDAADWFRGGLVAYCRPVKEDLLGIGAAAVVSREAVVAMARNVTALLGAAIGLAVTGVGGPEPEDGVAAGTVWIAVSAVDRNDAGDEGDSSAAGGRVLAELHHFEGDPESVLAQTCDAALLLLASAIHSWHPPGDPGS